MKAFLKNYRQSPRKVRLVADLVRGKNAGEALTLLSFTNKDAAVSVKKLIKSAIANAGDEEGKKDLIIDKIQVDKGITFTRHRPRARGRAAPIRKRTSRVSVQLAEQKSDTKTKSAK